MFTKLYYKFQKSFFRQDKKKALGTGPEVNLLVKWRDITGLLGVNTRFINNNKWQALIIEESQLKINLIRQGPINLVTTKTTAR